MKMGTILSQCPYDAAATSCDFALRLMRSCFPDFAGWSGYPSITGDAGKSRDRRGATRRHQRGTAMSLAIALIISMNRRPTGGR
jgi:hypothetical protein